MTDELVLSGSSMFKRWTIFLDRDGTLIKAIPRPDFIKQVTAPFFFHELEFVPKVKEVLAGMKEMGYLRIMVTNQPDVAHGYMSQKEWDDIHNTVIDELKLDDYYMCRHTADDDCPYKKPSPMMLIAAADKWGIDLKNSIMIGDTRTDMLTGRAAGCKTILVRGLTPGLNYNHNRDGIADLEIDNLSDLLITGD